MAGISGTSLSGLGISGLSSGLDTSGIITKLMSIEQLPQTALKTKLSSATTYRTALQSLNTSVAAIATTAAAAAKSGALASFTASSSSSAVTAKASSTAIPGTLSFTVERLASSQVSVTQPLTDSATTSIPAITFRTGSGSMQKDTTVELTSNRLDDVVEAINASSAGVSATKVPAGTSSSGVQQYRLQFASKDAGAGSTFSAVVGRTYDSGTTMPLTQITAAQDAQVTLYGGTAAEQVVTSSSNTFSSLMGGVDVTVSAVSAAATTVTVAADSTAATTSAQTLTASLITLFSGIAAASAITTTASSSGASSSTTGSVFTGDSLVRSVKDSLLSAVSGAVGTTTSPSTIGITLTKEGTITFDQAKFAAAMQSDPSGTTSLFQTIAGRVADAAKAVSDSSTGTLTQRITSQQSTESRLNKEIGDWDTRLAAIQLQYTNQFNALETALNSLSSQAGYLTSQITGLTTNYQNTK